VDRGYVGKIARVDLTHQKVKKEPIDENATRRFVGGVGYAAKILWDELKPGIDPFGPENKLIMATGPLTGTLAPNSGSYSACFKSPLTGIWGEARSGGNWGAFLKYAGFDMVIIEGRSEKPVYLSILDESVEIRSAQSLLGKNIIETDEIVKEEIGMEGASVACIGIAGEKRVRFAAIMNDLDRAAGRCGGGAVMGSKNLKAIAVNGHRGVKVARPKEFINVVHEIEANMINHLGRIGLMAGTIGSYTTCSAMGDLPTKYGWSGSWDRAEVLYETFLKTNYIKPRACWGCVIGCGRYSEATDKYSTPPGGGPEYETTGALTAFCLMEDTDALIKANYLCNIYGLDTISTGHMIAFAMLCDEKGLITKEEADGLGLSWGNPETVISLIEQIARKQGLGAILAEGIVRAAAKFGGDAPELAMHVKGLDWPMHDPRAGKSLAVQYGTATRGMCHIHPQECHDYECFGTDWDLKPHGLPEVKDRFAEDKSKAAVARLLQDYGITPDIMGVCKFPQSAGFKPEMYAAILSAATGWNYTVQDLLRLGERVFTLQRCFNAREGMRRKDDMLPKGFSIPEATGSAKGSAVKNYESMLKEYYELRGYDKNTGVPTRRKLQELELLDIVTELEEYVPLT